MGSPLGPSSATMFMCALKQKLLDYCLSVFKPLLYRRYVDDTFCIFRNKQQIEKLLSYITFFHRNITFTAEMDAGNNLPFLETLVT